MIGRRRLAAAVRAAFGAEPPVGMATELAEGPAEHVLVGRSADADLLVLGTTTPACQARRSIGPVIRACLSRARCAVLIVRAAAQPQAAFRSHLGERTPHRLRDAGEADA